MSEESTEITRLITSKCGPTECGECHLFDVSKCPYTKLADSQLAGWYHSKKRFPQCLADEAKANGMIDRKALEDFRKELNDGPSRLIDRAIHLNKMVNKLDELLNKEPK